MQAPIKPLDAKLTWIDIQLNLPQSICDYARSYRLPTDVDLQRINNFRSTCTARLAAIDDEISQLELPKCWHIRRELRAEAALIQARLDACDSLVAIHRQLPQELLVLIFQHYLDGLDIENLQDKLMFERLDVLEARERLDALEKLCLVSLSWRAAARSNPAF
jgi:hypothetical protein